MKVVNVPVYMYIQSSWSWKQFLSRVQRTGDLRKCWGLSTEVETYPPDQNLKVWALVPAGLFCHSVIPASISAQWVHKSVSNVVYTQCVCVGGGGGDGDKWNNKQTNTGLIIGIIRGVRYAKSLRVHFLHRRSPSWTTLVLYSRAVFFFNEPTKTLWMISAETPCWEIERK